MQALLGRLLLMVLLAAAGGGLWAMGQAERRLAEGHQRLATLQYRAAGDGSDEIESSLRYIGDLPSAGETLRGDVRGQRATSQYWLEDYAALEPQRDASGAPSERDPDLLFLAANASYHAVAQQGAGAADRQEVVRRLEDVMKGYVDVLKSRPGHADAAYNYEFVARRRLLLAQPRPAAPKPDAPSTILGRPGAPPAARFNQFRVVVPKQQEEREDPDAGRGNQKERKG